MIKSMTRIHCLPRKDCLGRFLLDLFVFSTLANGILCTSSQVQSNELKNFDVKRIERDERFDHIVPRAAGQPISSGNVFTATAFFDKMLHWIFDHGFDRDKVSKSREEERSFGFGQRFVGHRKRLQFALLPIMYKMGVMTTLLTGLTVFALKGLTIGLILLMFSLGNHFIKHGKQWNQSGQPIHVHVHSSDKVEKYGKYHEFENEVSSGPWDREEVQDQYLRPYVSESWESYRPIYYHQSSDLSKSNTIV